MANPLIVVPSAKPVFPADNLSALQVGDLVTLLSSSKFRPIMADPEGSYPALDTINDAIAFLLNAQATATPVPATLATALGFTASNIAETGAKLTWNSPPNAQTYTLLRGLTNAQIAATPIYAGTSQEYVDGGLAAATQHFYFLIAKANGYNDSNAAVLSLTTLANTSEAPFIVQAVNRLDIASFSMASLSATKQSSNFKLTNAAGVVVYNGLAIGTVRGNSTAGQLKKPMKQELPVKISVLNFIVDDTTNVMAEFFDMTGLKNPTYLNLARAMGMVAPKSRPLEIYGSAGYDGLYNITERPKKALVTEYIKRVTGSTNLDGVVVVVIGADYQEVMSELKYYRTPLIGLPENYVNVMNSYTPHHYSIELPKPEEVTDLQFNSIRQRTLDAEASLFRDWLDMVSGPQVFYDGDGLLDYAIHEEVCKDVDAGAQSRYWILRADGKFFPMIWDRDGSAPYNGLFGVPPDPAQWWGANTPQLKPLYRNLNFRRAIKQRWVFQRQKVVDSIAFFQAQADKLIAEGAAQRNVTRWGVSAATGYSGDRSAGWQGFLDNLAACKKWMQDRLANLDIMFANMSEFDPSYQITAGYNYHTTRWLNSIILDGQGMVANWKDANPLGEQPVTTVASKAFLNLNVDGYPAIVTPKADSGMRYANNRTAKTLGTDGYTFVHYVKLRSDIAVDLHSNSYAASQIDTTGYKRGHNFNGSGNIVVNTPLALNQWHTIIESASATGCFIAINGVITTFTNDLVGYGEWQPIKLYTGPGNLCVRHFSSYSRKITEQEATLIHQRLLLEFDSSVTSPRFDAPVLAAQNVSGNYLDYTIASGKTITDYEVTYDAGDIYQLLTVGNLEGGVIRIRPTTVFSLAGKLGVRLKSTLTTQNSTTTYNTLDIGDVNFLNDSNFQQGSAYWLATNATINTGNVSFQNNGTILQFIPANTLVAGREYKFVIEGAGTFFVSKNEDYFGGQPNQNITLVTGTPISLNMGYGTVTRNISITLKSLADGGVITRVRLVFQ